MPAFIGLIGVIVGAVLTGLGNYLLARRKDRLSARVAARLVRDDLYGVACLLEDAIDSGVWPPGAPKAVDLGVWKEQRLHLAAVTSYKEYGTIMQAVVAVTRLHNWLAGPAGADAITDADKSRLQFWLSDLSAGLATLKDLAA